MIGIGRVDRATRQRHLAGVRAHVGPADGERDNELPIGVGVDGQQGGGRTGGREVSAVESAPGRLAVGSTRQQALVERDRATRTGQRLLDPCLPAVVSA